MKRSTLATMIGATMVLAATARPAAGQGISVSVARWLTDPAVMDYRIGVSGYAIGPVRLLPFGQLAVGGPKDDRSSLGGIGGDALILLTGAAKPYLVGGVSVGLFDLQGSFTAWSGWSAGLGAELIQVAGLGIGVEGRYQRLSRGDVSGISLGVRIGTSLGRPAAKDPPIAPAREPVRAIPEERPPARDEARPPALATAARGGSAVTARAVDAAIEVMGTPYRWGGTDTNGFDCSGLIQFAYRRAGVELPRKSANQGAAGRSVGIAFADLAAGDILVFAREPGAEITHVGLYIGDGRFIHSASKGTQISRLASDDPAGRWWFDRWVDSRRVSEQESGR